ncbi:hypothetical protein VN97_g6146 [Penicillium thymicola]|uniref:Uncharacterized protein n=1 Tax=Penicillium thymicola TaxID=293382 RepID=A0AAI9X8J6_PENTH|nr:hypothetical protein VN97_g6146 [Penicillium thymicola]
MVSFSSSLRLRFIARRLGLGWALYLSHGIATWKGMQIPKTGDGVYGIIIWIGSSNEKITLSLPLSLSLVMYLNLQPKKKK